MKKLFDRLWSTLIEEVFTNWRLVLLGLTGLALSVASGWTTWDGMTNFTGNPVLSFLITFGIQGVMLIAAWLIGETFALGLRGSAEGHSGGVFWGLFLLLGIVVLAVFAALMSGPDPAELGRSIFDFGQRWTSTVAGAILLLALIGAVIYGITQKEIIGPYLRGGKIIVQNLPIWVMFVACLATSVFFSFDSLFSTIFPAEERKRAGDIRAQNQVSGILADVETLLKTRQVEARAALFQSAPWSRYDASLDLVQSEARRAPDLISSERKKRLAAQQLEVQRFREQQSTAEGRFRNLKAEKDRRLEIIDRLEKLRPPIVAEVDGLESEVQIKRKALISARADAKAEARGVGNTQRAGRGPKYRELQKVVTRLSIEEELLAEQLRGVKGNLEKLDRQITVARREAEAFSTQIATYGSQADAAKKMLEAGQVDRGRTGEVPNAVSADAFERSRSEFRQNPTRAQFAALQSQCSSLLTALNTVPQLKASVGGVDCEPREANALAARVFDLNQGVENYKTQCGKAASAKFGDVDALIKHGQKCVLLSGLSGADSAAFRSGFNRIELNRDDKAHRFVVSWNAFMDGNRLAYLALTIALAIDGLVFMSGLFGANSLRTPLAEGSGAEGRTAAQLDDLMESALLPDKLFSSDVVLGTLSPSNRQGFAQKINMTELSPDNARIVRNVLNAGSVIGLVVEDENDPDIYFIRRQLFEKISHIRQREIRLTNTVESAPGLRKALEAALLPEHEILANISRVKKFMHPSDEREGFGIEVDLTGADGDTSERVRRVLTTGASHGVVKPHPKIARYGFLIKDEFTNQLIAIREERLKSHGDAADQTLLIDFDRPHDNVDIGFDKGSVTRQLGHENIKALAAPGSVAGRGRGSAVDADPDTGTIMDMPDYDDGGPADDAYQNRTMDLAQEFVERLKLSGLDLATFDTHEARNAIAGLGEALRQIAGLDKQISSIVDSFERDMLMRIKDCGQALKNKYSAHGDFAEPISAISETLREYLPLFVLQNRGAYETAIRRKIEELVNGLDAGNQDAERQLEIYQQHAEVLGGIDRSLGDSAPWEQLVHSLNDFLVALKPVRVGHGDQTAGQQIN